MKFAIVIVAPPGYEHWRAFEEVAQALHFGLIRAGYESVRTINHAPAGHQAIVLGASLVPPGQALPPGAIIFNLEQIVDGSMWLLPQYVDLMRHYRVWDYTEGNVEALRRLGVSNVTVVPLGYVPELTRIPARDKEFDVLFYGSGNARREKILQALHRGGASVKSIFGVYGADRDEMIARARIVINIHFYEAKLFEIVRVGYLLANRVCVVSESSADIGSLEIAKGGGLVVSAYGELVETTLRLLKDDAAREDIARRGFSLFCARDQAVALRQAIRQDIDA